MAQIEYIDFFSADEKTGSKTHHVAAHFYCRLCGTEFSHSKVDEVRRRAEAHAVACP